MRVLFGAPLLLLFANGAFAQQIGSVDLTRLSKHVSEHENLPHACKKLLDVMFADGVKEPEDHVPRQIVVEVVSVEDAKPALGSELAAEVRLENSGTQPIEIPWSTEFSAIEKGQGPDSFIWDEGTFDFTLKNQQGRKVLLKSLTAAIYGSGPSVGSELTIRPGESLTASVKFTLEGAFPIPEFRLTEGEWQLSAKWVQTARSWSVDRNCSVVNGYYAYDRYYEQQNPSITIQVNTGRPATDRIPPQ